MRELADSLPAGSPFFACDRRGIGQSQPDTCGLDSFRAPYGCDYFYAIHGVMLDRLKRSREWESAHFRRSWSGTSRKGTPGGVHPADKGA